MVPSNPETLRHVASLKMTVPQYREWCVRNGFTVSLNKSWKQLTRENLCMTRIKALYELKSKGKKMTPKRVIEMARSGDAPKDTLAGKITEIFNDKGRIQNLDEELFLNVIEFLLTESAIFENARDRRDNIAMFRYLPSIVQVVLEHENWIQPYDSWKPKTHNSDRQFSAFLRHLFAKYEVPVFLDYCWDETTIMPIPVWISRKWFIEVGAGKNITNATEFSNYFPMTKKMAHFFMQAPPDYALYKAWKYGQVMAMGGSAILVTTILGTKLGGNIFAGDQNDFILSIIKFFIDNPMLDRAQMGPLVDYIWHQKYEPQKIFVARGQVEDRGPIQPNFSMSGRSVQSLMTQMLRWHRQLGKETKGGDRNWPHSVYKDFELQEGSNESKNVKFWKITEFLSSQELKSEGRAMHHCVASYAGSCASGSSSVWALTCTSSLGRFKHLTLEVDMRNHKIDQMRGPHNRMPEPREIQIVGRWATREKLAMPSF